MGGNKFWSYFQKQRIEPLGTAFGGITDIETGPDGFLYLLTVDRESDGEGKIYRISLSQ